MNLEQFWQLIESTNKESEGVPSRQYELLVKALVEMSVQDILDYDRFHETLMNRAFTTDVWNAAYIVNSCGNDDFTDFRGWLIAQGKMNYERVLRDPDSLVDLVDVADPYQCTRGNLAYVTYEAYEQKTGDEDGVPGYGFHPKLTGILPLSNPSEEYQVYYPKLWAKFGYKWVERDEDGGQS